MISKWQNMYLGYFLPNGVTNVRCRHDVLTYCINLDPVDYVVSDILQQRVYRCQICDVNHQSIT